MAPNLSKEEQELAELLLLLTGREDRLADLLESQGVAVSVIWPFLKSSRERGWDFRARCDLLNRIVIALGIQPMSYLFFKTVLRDVDLASLSQLRKQVERFRVLCMLEFGGFRYGYRAFNSDSEGLSKAWDRWFPDADEAERRAAELRNRPAPVGLRPIPPSQLFSLGYLASEQALRINEARKLLLRVLDLAVQSNVEDWSGLQAVANREDVSDLPRLLASAGLPGVEELHGGLWVQDRQYSEVIGEVMEKCQTVDEVAIEQAKRDGMHNSSIYMALHDLDVYVATSMRDPLHFTTNWTFVRSLFHDGDFAQWNIRYFDPTQSYLPDRVQKGLMECLMIKRASVTVYNAQESDTFGKDAELGVTLAQRKPGIVYVARLFSGLPGMALLYDAIDQSVRRDRDSFIEALVGDTLLEKHEAERLRAPEKGKSDVLDVVLTERGREILSKRDGSELALELVHGGYTPPSEGDGLLSFCIERVSLLERRALTFREIHPLSLQTSPLDGVARGIIVTRSVGDTRRVLSGILRDALEYEIVEETDNWLLFDTITHSPIRVVTKNAELRTAFWSAGWGPDKT